MIRLTDVTYWEEVHWKLEPPRRLRRYRDFDFETVELLHRAAGAGPRRVLEIGAGASRILPYLGRKYGYKVFGSDFSIRGCRLLGSNLALEGQTARVVCEDLLQSSLQPESFDLVYSSGVIEHFEDTRAVIAEHLRLVKPGGSMALIVPNLQGLQARIVRRLAPELWRRHRVFGPRDLAAHFQSLDLGSVRSGYLGSFFLYVGRTSEWSGVKAWPRPAQWLVQSVLRLVNGALSLMFRLVPLRPHSRLLSPGFFAVGEKPRV